MAALAQGALVSSVSNVSKEVEGAVVAAIAHGALVSSVSNVSKEVEGAEVAALAFICSVVKVEGAAMKPAEAVREADESGNTGAS